MVLRHIDPMISADLMHVLMLMGHGDEIVFADRNFPAVSLAKRLLPYQGVSITQLLPKVLHYFPIDHAVEHPVKMMLIPADTDYKGNVKGTYQQILDTAHGSMVSIESMKREQFYERASKAFAVVATSDSARFANIIIRKGVVRIGEEV
jgi:L-fucose mutarotase